MQVKVAFTETHQLEAGKDVGGHLPKPKGEQMIVDAPIVIERGNELPSNLFKKFNLICILSLSEVPYPSCCPTKGCYPGAFAMWLL